MRKTIFTMMLLGIFPFLHAQMAIQQVEPLSWWTDMNCPLTLMLHGTDLSDAQVSIHRLSDNKVEKTEATGLVVKGQHNAESKNYLFVDLDVREAGTYRITLKKGKQSVSTDYVIAERRPNSRYRKGFTSADVIYLIMSDRFVDGDPSTNSSNLTAEKANPKDPTKRYGGDIAGIVSQLDRLAKLGVTTIWPTPLLLDNEPSWSYHGYACADYYHIDPRMGSNESYRAMVETAHSKGLKFIMDAVPNHCGAAHWWIKDLPYADWLSYKDFTHTNGAFSTNYDPNASQYDRMLNDGGWFDTPMPDMNLNNPDLLQYFKQWAIWWIEYANLDGLRVDTYPYVARDAAASWTQAILDEYPNINIVGETWTRPTSAVAYWQHDSGNKDGFNSPLPTVMDFPTTEAIRAGFGTNKPGWGEGMAKIYDVLSQDYLYGDVNQLLLFLSNHDMARFSDLVYDGVTDRVKLGMTLLATMRGIPQMLYGEEYNMRSKNTENPGDHSYLRAPLPLGKLSPEQQDMNDYVTKLLNWRKGKKVIHNGRTMHFYSNDNTYAFFRYNEDEAVFVFVNASEEPKIIPTDHYKEILSQYAPLGVDILSEHEIDLSSDHIEVAPLSSMIVELGR